MAILLDLLQGSTGSVRINELKETEENFRSCEVSSFPLIPSPEAQISNFK